jgi:hypothetical protein
VRAQRLRLHAILKEGRARRSSRETPNPLTRSSIRLWFCLAVAVIAAAIADPLVEYGSNAGWLGYGSFTDRSNLDVLPALALGIGLLVLHLVFRVRAALTDPDERGSQLWRASRTALAPGIVRLLPLTFAIQIVILYCMETIEQFVVYGHTLGAMTWLGGPPLLSLSFHALVCALVASALAWGVRRCARGTLRVIGMIRACAMLLGRDAPPPRRRRDAIVFGRFAPLVCRIGERAPPLPGV